MIFKIAFRNVFRQKRRTILTMLTMLGGFTLASVSIGWSDGTYAYIIDMFTRNQLGHIQIHNEDYLDRPSLYKYIENYQTIGKNISKINGVEAWAPRLYSAGIASAGEKSAGVRIIGLDPERESAATGFEKKITQGTSFPAEQPGQALIGTGLSRILKAPVGGEIVVVSQAADGSIANDVYSVAGLIESGDDLTDRFALYLPLAEAQELLVLDNRVHEIIIIAENLDRIQPLVPVITKAVNDTLLDVSPWQEFAASFYHAMKIDQKGMWISLLVIIIIVAVGVLNTVLMSVLERTREYGVLKAMGSRPSQLFRLVLYEVNLMALGSIVIGTGLSLLANYLLSIHGISLPEPFTFGGVEFRTMYAEINTRSLVIPAITIILSATLVAIFPAVRAGKTDPAKAMRSL